MKKLYLVMSLASASLATAVIAQEVVPGAESPSIMAREYNPDGGGYQTPNEADGQAISIGDAVATMTRGGPNEGTIGGKWPWQCIFTDDEEQFINEFNLLAEELKDASQDAVNSKHEEGGVIKSLKDPYVVGWLQG